MEPLRASIYAAQRFRESIYEEGRLSFEGEISSLLFDNSISYHEYNRTRLFSLHNDVKITIDQLLWRFQFRNMKLKIDKKYVDTVNQFKKDKNASLEDIFRNKELKRDFVNKLNKVTTSGKIVNQTSVVVMHEPIHKYRVHSVSTVFDCSFGTCRLFRDLHLDLREFSRTILTGDIEFNKNHDDNEDLVVYIKEKSYHSVFQYPHHGAKGEFPLNSDWIKGVVIIPVGITNRYDHPSTTALGYDPFNYYIVNERTAFDYVITM